jgi:hypothetical protein
MLGDIDRNIAKTLTIVRHELHFVQWVMTDIKLM